MSETHTCLVAKPVLTVTYYLCFFVFVCRLFRIIVDHCSLPRCQGPGPECSGSEGASGRHGLFLTGLSVQKKKKGPNAIQIDGMGLGSVWGPLGPREGTHPGMRVCIC